jgi:type IV pilus assembly protein PilY1
MKKNPYSYSFATSVFLLAISIVSAGSFAATDLSDAPLASGTSADVKPNVMFILDDSGSMNSAYMPDGVSSNTVGYLNSSCNTIAYNPATTYEIPKTYDGGVINSASQTAFGAAYNDGYYSFTGNSNASTNLANSYYFTLNPAIASTTIIVPDSGVCNLSDSPVSSTTTGICYPTVAGNNYNSASAPAKFRTRTSADSGTNWTAWSDASSCTVDNTNPSLRQCDAAYYYRTDSPPACPAGTTLVWEGHLVSSTSSPASGDERQNYANWHSYYRTRVMMMKAASGLAFAGLTNKYRVGFMTIHPGTYAGDQNSTGAANGSSVDSARFLGITDFDPAAGGQRQNWYTKLYAQTAGTAATGQYTPLRSALTAAGRYFAGKNDLQNKGMIPTSAADPVQYSCQQNFTILTTDGYWNSGTGRQLNGTSAVANQDGDFSALDANNPTGSKFAISPRPIYDGATSTRVTTDKENEYKLTTTGCSSTNVAQLQERTSTLQSTAQQPQSGTSRLQKQITQLQTRTNQLQQQTSQLQAVTSQLQVQTSRLQAETSTLQVQTSRLQAETSALQIQTTQLQATEVRFEKCTSGPSTGCSAITFNCTGGTGDAGKPFCRLRTTVTNGVASCTIGSFRSISGNNYVTTACNSVVTSPFTDTASNCTIDTTPDASGNTTQCQYAAWSALANYAASSCTNTAQSSGSAHGTVYSVHPAVRNCQTVVTSAFANTASNCTITAPNGSGISTQCQYGPWGALSNHLATSCTAVAQSSGAAIGTVYSVKTAVRNCQTVVTSAFADTASTCTVTTPNGSGISTQCQYGAPVTTDVSSCTVATASPGPTNYTVKPARTCQYLDGAWSDVSSCTTVAKDLSSPHSVGTSTQCQWAGWSPLTATATCTVATQDNTNPYTGNSGTNGVARDCTPVVTTPYADAATCTETTTPDASGYTTQCQYTNWTAYANVGSCTVLDRSVAPNYTVATATQCNYVPGSSASVTTCTPSQTVACQYSGWSGWTASPSCVAVPQSPSAPYVATAKECATNNVSVAGQKMQYRTFTSTSTATMSGGVQVGTAVDTGWTPASPSWVDAGACTPIGSATVPYDPMPSRRRPITGEPPLPTAPCTAWPCVATSASSGGSSDSLADVAQYYYVNDLRPTGTTGANGLDVSENNVPASGIDAEDDKATWQHMTTFTMGLGLSGNLTYQSDYKNATTGAFANLRSGSVNWPVPSADDATAIDDLWHAAVNGRGLYFSASDPNSVVSSLNAALAGINARVASAAAAATSTLEPVAGDNYAFIAKYVTSKWTGDVEAKTIALADDAANGVHAGDVSATAVWSAASKLAAQVGDVCDNRIIKLFHSGATNNLVDFKWNSYACDAGGAPTGSAVTGLDGAEQAYFGAAQLSALGQYPTMSASQKTAAVGAPLLNFLRGQRGHEGFVANSADAFYRSRDGILGDIVSAQPLYVRDPARNYTDSGYAAFKAAHANRAPVVYIAANDGMLHALNAAVDGGNELWAFIPSTVLPNLHHLADTDYSANHLYFTDGAPISGDIYDTTGTAQWRTILVGGLNKGGNSYYALDITDPATPKALWQFTDADMGYSYGNPVIGKLIDGRWVVFVTSGINNSDGVGYLYVLNAATGTQIYKIATSAGSAGTPSGLTKITSWVTNDSDKDMTVNHLYGVDLLGNVWRFDVNNIIDPAGREASLLVTVKDASGNPQPITTKPRVALVGGDPWVYVGTGRYLGASDLTDESVQSVYGFRDDMTLADPAQTLGPMIADARAELAHQTLVNVGSGLAATREFSACNTVTRGWYVDLPDLAERVNIDMKLEFGTLIVASNVPVPSACRVGGYSWLTMLDTANACGSTTYTVTDYNNAGPSDFKHRETGFRLKDSVVVGDSIVQIAGKVLDIKQFSDGTTTSFEPNISPSPPLGRRTSWREVLP